MAQVISCKFYKIATTHIALTRCCWATYWDCTIQSLPRCLIYRCCMFNLNSQRQWYSPSYIGQAKICNTVQIQYYSIINEQVVDSAVGKIDDCITVFFKGICLFSAPLRRDDIWHMASLSCVKLWPVGSLLLLMKQHSIKSFITLGIHSDGVLILQCINPEG